MRRVAGLTSIGDALRLVLERALPLEHELVPLASAAGRVTAEAERARVDLPPFPSSAMDGYAVRASDTPGDLPITAHVAAGRPAERSLGAGEAMEISTGGVVPVGADAVVPVERVQIAGGRVQVPDTVEAGSNVRPRGGDAQAGDVVVEPGVVLGPTQLGALAAAGIPVVGCARRPRAVVLPTGTELRAPGETLAPGEIYESNALILAAQLASAGAVVETLAPVGDDAAATRDALARALEAADVVVTSGGVSVGPHDLVRAVAAELGVEELFWRIAMRPGKPVAFGIHGHTLVFGLPGNPVSSLVGFELLVRPALAALQGARDPGPHYLPGRAAVELRRNAGRDELVRARSRVEDGAVLLDPIIGQGSHMIARAAAADALVLVPRGEGALAAGAPVSYLRL